MHAHGTPAELRQALVDAGAWTSYAEQFCDEACLNRYLRARGHDVTKAAAMLKATMEWRQAEGIDSLEASEFAATPFMREGWVYVDGNDAAGRSVVMFRKRKDPFPMELEGLYHRYMAFVIEGAIKNMKQGAEQWVWVLDLAVYSSSNAPHLSTTLGVLSMLSNHYPERLHKAYVCNAPAIFSVGYRLISPFVDPVSKSKAEFVHTSDYEKQGAKSSSGGGHWWSSKSTSSGGAHSTWSSWFGGSSSASEATSSSSSSSRSSSPTSGPASPSTASAAGSTDADADVVISEAAAPKGPGSFGPFLHHYNTPFCPARYAEVLSAAGMAAR